jgi:hypothetical protein
MPSLYAFTNDHEAVAEVVRDAYLEKRDGRSDAPLATPLTATKDSQKDRQMRENYLDVLHRRGFIE